MYASLSVPMPISQKKASNPIIDGCQVSCGYWELNSGLLQEQPMLFQMTHLSSPQIIYFELCLCVGLCMLSAGCADYKRALGPLELELQAVAGCRCQEPNSSILEEQYNFQPLKHLP